MSGIKRPRGPEEEEEKKDSKPSKKAQKRARQAAKNVSSLPSQAPSSTLSSSSQSPSSTSSRRQPSLRPSLGPSQVSNSIPRPIPIQVPSQGPSKIPNSSLSSLLSSSSLSRSSQEPSQEPSQGLLVNPKKQRLRGKQKWKHRVELNELKLQLDQAKKGLTEMVEIKTDEVNAELNRLSDAANELAREKLKLQSELDLKAFDLATVQAQLVQSNKSLAMVIRTNQSEKEKLTTISNTLLSTTQRLIDLEKLDRALDIVVDNATCVSCLNSPKLVVLLCGCAYICATCYLQLKTSSINSGRDEVPCPSCRNGHPTQIEPRLLHANITNQSLRESLTNTMKGLVQ